MNKERKPLGIQAFLAVILVASLAALPIEYDQALATEGGYRTAMTTQASTTTPISSKKGTATIANTKSKATIQADVKLKGKGTGSHAKLVICTPTSAVSFGLQFDKYARAPYTGKTMAMIENVKSNDAGGQQYLWPKKLSASKNKTYRLMLTLNKNGTGSVYINGNKIGSYKNPGLKNAQVYLRVEGAARKNGDTVTATFKNIKLKNNGQYYPSKTWGTYQFTSNKTVKATKVSSTAVTISGKISGFPANADWDSPGYYDKASGIIQFVG